MVSKVKLSILIILLATNLSLFSFESVTPPAPAEVKAVYCPNLIKLLTNDELFAFNNGGILNKYDVLQNLMRKLNKTILRTTECMSPKNSCLVDELICLINILVTSKQLSQYHVKALLDSYTQILDASNKTI